VSQKLENNNYNNYKKNKLKKKKKKEEEAYRNKHIFNCRKACQFQ
jgi:hypothetical protein